MFSPQHIIHSLTCEEYVTCYKVREKGDRERRNCLFVFFKKRIASVV